jgi:hypothetical protein
MPRSRFAAHAEERRLRIRPRLRCPWSCPRSPDTRSYSVARAQVRRAARGPPLVPHAPAQENSTARHCHRPSSASVFSRWRHRARTRSGRPTRWCRPARRVGTARAPSPDNGSSPSGRGRHIRRSSRQGRNDIWPEPPYSHHRPTTVLLGATQLSSDRCIRTGARVSCLCPPCGEIVHIARPGNASARM